MSLSKPAAAAAPPGRKRKGNEHHGQYDTRPGIDHLNVPEESISPNGRGGRKVLAALYR
jgi:hypothetical protein